MSESDGDYITPTPFECQYCDRSFTTRTGCSVHMTRQHVQEDIRSCFSKDSNLEKDEYWEPSNLSLSNIFLVEDNKTLLYDHDVTVSSTDDLCKDGDFDKCTDSYSKLEDTFTPRVSNEELRFAELCCKYDMSDAAANDWREFSEKKENIRTWETIKKNLHKEYNDLDPDNGSYLSYSFSLPIQVSKTIKKRLVLEDPRKQLAALLRDPQITTPETLKRGHYTPMYDDVKGQAYYECTSGEWMKLADEWVSSKYGEDVEVLPIIFFSDGTVVNSLGSRSTTPVVLQCGLHDLQTRQSLFSKKLLGYLPEISNLEAQKHRLTSKSKLVDIRRDLYNASWSKILEALDEETLMEVDLPHGMGTRKYKLTVMHFVADHPEAMKLVGVKNSWKTNMPCRICKCKQEDLLKFEENLTKEFRIAEDTSNCIRVIFYN